jgi:hypothetical protein
MSHKSFELNTSLLEANYVNQSIIDGLVENVESIKDLLVFDSKTENAIGLDSGGFSHNIIGMCLQSISKASSYSLANSVVKGLGLENLGWSCE